MSYSHLYPGFHFVGVLPSIYEQRLIQRHILSDIIPLVINEDFLSIGCGYGEELDFFLLDEQVSKTFEKIIAIDITNVKREIQLQPMIFRLNGKFNYYQHDLLKLNTLKFTRRPSIVQCGFVIEDIEYYQKDLAFMVIQQNLADKGWLIYSEMFLDNLKRRNPTADRQRQQAVADLYDRFIEEAQICFKEGRLSEHQYNLLCGDGKTPGLFRTRKLAMEGKRDFFESLEKTVERLEKQGFEIQKILDNKCNPFLKVIIAKKL